MRMEPAALVHRRAAPAGRHADPEPRHATAGARPRRPFGGDRRGDRPPRWAGSSFAHRTRLSLPFAFPEAGKVDLRVVAHGRTIASGSRTTSGTAKVTLKLSASGRRLLKRTRG